MREVWLYAASHRGGIIFLPEIVMKKGNKEKLVAIASWILIILLVLSTLLIFVIKPWIVLIINFCGNVLYRILFRTYTVGHRQYVLQYLIACFLSIGIMLLIMFFPDKICDGILQHIDTGDLFSDIEFVRMNFGNECIFRDREILTEKVITRYHIDMGIMMTILLIQYIICGIVVIDGDYDGSPFCLALPLVSMGALIIFDSPIHFGFMDKIIRGVLSVAYIAVIEGGHYFFEYGNFGGNSGGNGGGGDEYDIIIIKH